MFSLYYHVNNKKDIRFWIQKLFKTVGHDALHIGDVVIFMTHDQMAELARAIQEFLKSESLEKEEEEERETFNAG